MSGKTAFSRREFVQGGLALVSTLGTMPTFLGHTSLAMAAPGESAGLGNRPGKPDDRVLVVVQLSGGNDGLNTIVPYEHGAYYDARPRLAVSKGEVLEVSGIDDVGLHPSLAPIKQMLDDGQAAVVQGVGYPNPNRSHFASMDVWHTGDTRGGHGVGWVGAAMDEYRQQKNGQVEATACICIGRNAPLAANGKTVKPVSFENPRLFQWAGKHLHKSLGPAYDKINRAGVLPDAGDPDDGSQAAYIMRTSLDAQIANDKILAAVNKGPQTSWPNGSLANQLKMVAAMICSNLPTRVYYVALGGFDTHSNQAFGHANNLTQFASAVSAFHKELKATGHDGRVLTMAFSEFGRRVSQNASNGTDHGTAGPMFLFGNMIRPGFHGKLPSLTNLDSGDLIYNMDFRSVYASVLDDWMQIDSSKALGRRFKPTPVVRT